MGDDCRGSRVAWLAKDEGRRRAMLASARSRAATLTLKESTCHQYPPCSPNCQLVRTRWHLDHTRRPEGDRLAEAAPVSCEPWPEARRLQAARGVKGWSEGRSRAMVASFACIIGVLRWGLTDDGYSSRCSRWRLSTSPVAPQAALWLSHAADSICARAGIDERLSELAAGVVGGCFVRFRQLCRFRTDFTYCSPAYIKRGRNLIRRDGAAMLVSSSPSRYSATASRVAW